MTSFSNSKRKRVSVSKKLPSWLTQRKKIRKITKRESENWRHSSLRCRTCATMKKALMTIIAVRLLSTLKLNIMKESLSLTNKSWEKLANMKLSSRKKIISSKNWGRNMKLKSYIERLWYLKWKKGLLRFRKTSEDWENKSIDWKLIGIRKKLSTLGKRNKIKTTIRIRLQCLKTRWKISNKKRWGHILSSKKINLNGTYNERTWARCLSICKILTKRSRRIKINTRLKWRNWRLREEILRLTVILATWRLRMSLWSSTSRRLTNRITLISNDINGINTRLKN